MFGLAITNFMNSLYCSKVSVPSIHTSALSPLSEDNKGKARRPQETKEARKEIKDRSSSSRKSLSHKIWSSDKWGVGLCTQMKVVDRETERRICILGRDKGLVESQCQCHVCQHCHDPITPSSNTCHDPRNANTNTNIMQILIPI